jgi:glycosyltransferase involved in cell wall biosynthesis
VHAAATAARARCAAARTVGIFAPVSTAPQAGSAAAPSPAAPFDVSIIMPAYNEEEGVGVTATHLLQAFEKAGVRLQLVAVDNGSRDRTGEVLRALQPRWPNLVIHRVEVNQGYGNGVLQGIPVTAAEWVGIIPADGQVDAEDVVRLFQSAAATNGNVVAKVRRRFRMDGLARKLVSTAYNLFVLALWPTLGSLDVNGSPKLLRRDRLLAMRLTSKEWFLDPELMIKAHYMGMRVLELNVFARMRGTGLSNVRASTCWQFFRDLLVYRFGGAMRDWHREHRAGSGAAASLPRG